MSGSVLSCSEFRERSYRLPFSLLSVQEGATGLHAVCSSKLTKMKDTHTHMDTQPDLLLNMTIYTVAERKALYTHYVTVKFVA